MRSVSRDVHGFARAYDRLYTSKHDLDLAFQQSEALLEVVPTGNRSATGRDKHVDQAVTSLRVAAIQQDCVRVSCQADVRKALPCSGRATVRCRLRSSGGIGEIDLAGWFDAAVSLFMSNLLFVAFTASVSERRLPCIEPA